MQRKSSNRNFPTASLLERDIRTCKSFCLLVAQAVVREGWTDFVGLGRMVLSYPTLPADCLLTGELQTKLICRTFSDCTTAPRHGMVSGCYPLDDFYKKKTEASRVKEIKKRIMMGFIHLLCFLSPRPPGEG